MSYFTTMKNEDIKYLNKILLDENNQLKILPANIYHNINPIHLKLFAHNYGIYSFPTIELAEWLMNTFDLIDCLEIGAGNGALAEYLGIRATDSKMHEKDEIQLLYSIMKQPLTTYGDNVEKLDAIEAIKKYQPKTVLAQWVTHKYNAKEPFREGNMYGVQEEDIINNVDTYIHVGNENVHSLKPILEKPHLRIKEDWIISRARFPEQNIIYIWSK